MRKQNWANDLAEYLRASQDKPFAWGSHDCAHFAAGAVEAVTGSRPELAHGYTERKALSLLARQGLRERAARFLGVPVPTAMAMRGDIVLTMDNNREALGVCFGENSFFLSRTGVVNVPTIKCLCAWRVE